MSTTRPAQGSLSEYPFPRLLATLNREEFTGMLQVSDARAGAPVDQESSITREIHLAAGHVAWAVSTDREEGLRAFLVRHGTITPDQWEEAEDRARRGTLRDALTEMGVITAREMTRIETGRVEECVRACFRLSEGTWRVRERQLPPGTPDLGIDPRPLVLEGVMRVADRLVLEREVGPLDTVFTLAGGALREDWIDPGRMSGELRTILNQIDGRRSVGDICSNTSLPDPFVRSMMAALAILGCVERAAASGAPVDGDSRRGTIRVPEAPIAATIEAAPGAVRPARRTGKQDMVAATDESGPVAGDPFMPDAKVAGTGKIATPAARASGAGNSATETPTDPSHIAASRAAATAGDPAVERGTAVIAKPPPAPIKTERPDRHSGSPSLSRVAGDDEDDPGAGEVEDEEDLFPWEDEIDRADAPPVLTVRKDRAKPSILQRMVGAEATGGSSAYDEGSTESSRSWFLLGGAAAVGAAALFLILFNNGRGDAIVLGSVPSPAAPNGGIAGPGPAVDETDSDARPVTSAGLRAGHESPPSAAENRDPRQPASEPAVEGHPSPGDRHGRPGIEDSPPLAPSGGPAMLKPSVRAVSGDSLSRAREELLAGNHAAAARSYRASLSEGRGEWSVQILLACESQTIDRAIADAPSSRMILLDTRHEGRPCYRLYWGRYTSREAAQEALSLEVPAKFRTGTARAWITRLPL